MGCIQVTLHCRVVARVEDCRKTEANTSIFFSVEFNHVAEGNLDVFPRWQVAHLTLEDVTSLARLFKEEGCVTLFGGILECLLCLKTYFSSE